MPPPVRPPFSEPEDHFQASCTSCQECVRACPENIIICGTGNLPELDFQAGECTFCGKCAEACPEPVFDLAANDPWFLELGLADNCLALSDIVCQACSDVCGQEAIHFDLQAGKVATPGINHDRCNGCGACVGTCPAGSLSLQPLKHMKETGNALV